MMSIHGSTRGRRRERKNNTETSHARLPEPQSDEILSWAEVNRTHRIRNGVYQRNGRLISLLTDFGRINPCYPDRVAESPDTIYYTGNGRRGDQYLNPGNRALLAAIEERAQRAALQQTGHRALAAHGILARHRRASNLR